MLGLTLAMTSHAAAGPATAGGARYAQLPMRFEVNEGQTDGRVKYLARGAGYTVFLTGEEAVLALRPGVGGEKAAVVRMRLLGGASGARVRGEKELAGRSHYFIGKDPKGWRRGVATYERVRYEGVYEGVDVVYYGRQGRLEYDLEVEAGAGTEGIRLGLEGVEGLRVDEAGDLVVELGEGEVKFQRPEAYQWDGGKKRAVGARYELAGKREVRFEVGEYDRRKELIIDPVLSYSTYLGGSGGDVAYAIATDASGNIYLAGNTGSTDFPLTSAFQTTNYGLGDAFIAKLDPTGTGLLYSTFLGGGGSDTATGIAVDTDGNAYIAGTTYSTNFPVPVDAFQAAYAGNGDGFVAKISADGSTLAYASYLGGEKADFAQGVAVDSSGSAYLTGSTQSTDFPVANFLQIANFGSSDVFVTKFAPSGTSLEFSTYLGGTSADLGQAIAVDGSGNVYVSGYTYSTNFPIQNAIQSTHGGVVDAFVTEIAATGASLLFSTYLGGSEVDRAFGMAVDSIGSVYITGDTLSPNFPITANAFQTNNKGEGDVFVTKLSPGGVSRVFSTLVGGGGTEQATALAIDSAGNAFVTGFTRSPDFPTLNPFQKILGLFGAGSCGGTTCTDAFALKLLTSGQMVYSSYLGGSGTDAGWAIAADPAGHAILAGNTTSANFPAIAGALTGEFLGSAASGNAFVARIADVNEPGIALSPQQVNFGNRTLNQDSDPQIVTLINAGSAPLSITSITASGEFSQTNDCGTAVPAGSGTCRIQIIFSPTTPGSRTDQIIVNDNASGSPHEITVTGTGVASSAGDLTVSPNSLSFPFMTVGETSLAQNVYIINNSQVAIELNDVTITGDFEQTNSCGSLPGVLNAGDGCTVSVTFTPQVSGSRTGTLSIQSNTTGGVRAVTLSGSGEAVFALSISERSTVIQVGRAAETQPTYTVSASSATPFTDSIALTCTSGAAQCTFDPTEIKVGEASSLKISNLTPTTTTPLNVAINGSGGGQSASVNLAIVYSDYMLSVSPETRVVTAGNTASYTVTVSPTNGFDGAVLLGCSGLPQETKCTWSPPAVYLNGNTVTATLTIETTSQQSSSQVIPPPASSPRLGPGPPIAAWFVVALLILGSVIAVARGRNAVAMARRRVNPQFVLLAVLLALASFAFGCGYEYSSIRINPAATGTPSGNYVIAVTGTLGNNSSVTRFTTVNLSVGGG